MTNHERIQNMSVDDMTKFLKEHTTYRCLHCSYHYDDTDCAYNPDIDCALGYKRWLESEVSK